MKDILKTLKERNQYIELETGLRTIILNSNSPDKAKKLWKKLIEYPICTFKVDGNFEDIIRKVNINLLLIIAQTLADAKENKDLKIGNIELFKKLRKEYLRK